MTVHELRECRDELNQVVLRAIKEFLFAEDIAPQDFEDVQLGAIRLLEQADVTQCSLTRRIPVGEVRLKRWGARARCGPRN